VIVFNRHLHRAEGLVRHFARSAAHMELRAMPWHESVIEAELAKTKVLINASFRCPTRRACRRSRPSCCRPSCWCSTCCTCRRDAAAARRACRRRGRGDERRPDAAPPDGRRVRAVDRPAGAIEPCWRPSWTRSAPTARLKGLGVRMLAPAHVMDNRAVGSATGRLRRGLSGLGRELDRRAGAPAYAGRPGSHVECGHR
jgi:hypothetical protein